MKLFVAQKVTRNNALNKVQVAANKLPVPQLLSQKVIFNFVYYFYMHVSVHYVACKWRYAPFVTLILNK